MGIGVFEVHDAGFGFLMADVNVSRATPQALQRHDQAQQADEAPMVCELSLEFIDLVVLFRSDRWAIGGSGRASRMPVERVEAPAARPGALSPACGRVTMVARFSDRND